MGRRRAGPRLKTWDIGPGPGPRETGRGPDQGQYPTPPAGGRQRIVQTGRQVAIGRICAGTSPVQRGMRWEGDLPPGYRLREDADLLVLLREDGSEVAAFNARGADPLEVIAAAWEDLG
jgi:hypothetical protein